MKNFISGSKIKFRPESSAILVNFSFDWYLKNSGFIYPLTTTTLDKSTANGSTVSSAAAYYVIQAL